MTLAKPKVNTPAAPDTAAAKGTAPLRTVAAVETDIGVAAAAEAVPSFVRVEGAWVSVVAAEGGLPAGSDAL